MSRKAMEAAMQLKEQLEKEKREEVAENLARKEAVLAANSSSSSPPAVLPPLLLMPLLLMLHGRVERLDGGRGPASVSGLDAGGGSSVAGFPLAVRSRPCSRHIDRSWLLKRRRR